MSCRWEPVDSSYRPRWEEIVWVSVQYRGYCEVELSRYRGGFSPLFPDVDSWGHASVTHWLSLHKPVGVRPT